ncbi:hypothetical protein ACWG5P_28020 [Streptomyces prasinus]
MIDKQGGEAAGFTARLLWSRLLSWWPAVQHFGLLGELVCRSLLLLFLLDLLAAVSW